MNVAIECDPKIINHKNLCCVFIYMRHENAQSILFSPQIFHHRPNLIRIDDKNYFFSLKKLMFSLYIFILRYFVLSIPDIYLY